MAQILCLVQQPLLVVVAEDLMLLLLMAHNMVLLVVLVAVVDGQTPKEMVVLEQLDKVMLVVLPHI
tara:strand:+ start:122 stop:319 length:198 start_codon:yes stop_codon:yes gene_type:complete